MRSSILIFAQLLFLLGCASAAATPETLETLISTAQIRELTDDLFYDNKIPVDITGDGDHDSIIYYSYSKLGPAPTCEALQNCEPETVSIITFYIDLPEGRTQIDVMCDSIGIYSTVSNLKRDIFCGPNTRLYWNGKKYIEGQNK